MSATDVSLAEYAHAIFPDRPYASPPSASEELQWKAVHFLFGQVTLRAQAYEDALARFVFMAMRLDGVSAGTERRVRRLTLGALQKEYANYCLLETAHADRMRRALEVRNSLAHSFYRRRMHLLETPEGRERVIAELSDAEELLKQERDEVYWNCSLLSGEAPL